MNNKMKLEFTALSANESLARNTIALFAMQMNPSVEQIIEIKTAVSEAVTNSIVHAYKGAEGLVTLKAQIKGNELHILVSDKGCGITDIVQAMEPFYTTAADQERSGMGFSVIECFMDKLSVISLPDKGTKVKMIKRVGVSDGTNN